MARYFILSALGLALCAMAFNSKLLKPIGILADIAIADAHIAEEGKRYTSSRSGISTTSYHFSYSFEVDGQTYRGRGPFGHLPNNIETIQYLRSNPHKNGPELSGHAYIDLGIFAITLLIFLVPLLVGLAAMKNQRRRQEAEQIARMEMLQERKETRRRLVENRGGGS